MAKKSYKDSEKDVPESSSGAKSKKKKIKNFMVKAFKSLFAICTHNSIELAKIKRKTYKNTKRYKGRQCQAKLPCSPDGSETEEVEFPMWDDPFAEYVVKDEDEEHKDEKDDDVE